MDKNTYIACYMKKSVTSDSQQSCQYQQDELNSLNMKSSRPLALEIHIMAWERHRSVAVLNRLMGS